MSDVSAFAPATARQVMFATANPTGGGFDLKASKTGTGTAMRMRIAEFLRLVKADSAPRRLGLRGEQWQQFLVEIVQG